MNSSEMPLGYRKLPVEDRAAKPISRFDTVLASEVDEIPPGGSTAEVWQVGVEQNSFSQGDTFAGVRGRR